MIHAEGFGELTPGERVSLNHEGPGQDGYPHRAVDVTADRVNP